MMQSRPYSLRSAHYRSCRLLQRACARPPRTGLGRAKASGRQELPSDDQPAPETLRSFAFDLCRDPLQEEAMRVLTPADRCKLDQNDDEKFYDQPRMVHHVGPAFRRRLTALYKQYLRPGQRVLDLCSSWASHLPPELPLSHVAGQGMNAAELAANGQLDERWVQDLNASPRLERVKSQSLNAIVCANGIQYLQQPEAVLAECRRALAPGGCLLLAFGSAAFAEKATAGWLGRDMQQRAQLVQRIMQAVGFADVQILQERLTPVADSGARSSAVSLDGEREDFCLVAARTPSLPLRTADNVGSWLVPPALQELDSSSCGVGGREGTGGITINGISPAPSTQNGAVSMQAQQQEDAAMVVSEQTLDRWRAAYFALASDAQQLGIPASALPPLPDDARPEDIRRCRDHLQNMVASFLSSGL